MLKILSITYTKNYGGGEESLKWFLLAIKDSYQNLLMLPKGILSEKLEGNIPLIISKGIGQLQRSSNRFWVFSLLRRFIVSFFEVLYVVFKRKPDLIHCFSEMALFYAFLPSKIMRRRIVCQMHNFIDNNIFWERLSLFLGKFVYRYIVVSEAVKKRLVEIGHKPEKICVLRNYIDSENVFNPEKVPTGVFRKKFALSSKVMLIGTIGATYHLKGQHLFLEAIDLLKKKNKISKDIKFLVIGGPRTDVDNRYFENLKCYAKPKNLTDSVLFTGNLASDFIPCVLRDIDVFIFCSVLPDALPRTNIEAMAMRKVIIASNIGGVPEQIEDGVSGFLFKPGDVKEFAECILTVINNFSSMSQIGFNARERVEKEFSYEGYKKNLSNILKEILQEEKTEYR